MPKLYAVMKVHNKLVVPTKPVELSTEFFDIFFYDIPVKHRWNAYLGLMAHKSLPIACETHHRVCVWEQENIFTHEGLYRFFFNNVEGLSVKDYRSLKQEPPYIDATKKFLPSLDGRNQLKQIRFQNVRVFLANRYISLWQLNDVIFWDHRINGREEGLIS